MNFIWKSCVGVHGKSQAYLTVYLTLVMTILLSLCLALVEGVRYNAMQLETECVADIAGNSVLAEYHRELFEQYNLLAVDSSYGTDYATRKNVEKHFEHYIQKNLGTEDIFLGNLLYRDFLGMELMDADITKVSLLTDGNGQVFRKQAVEAIQEDVGIGLWEDIQQWITVIEENDMLERDLASEKEAADEEIEEIIEEEEEDEEDEIFEETGEWVDVDISFDNPTEKWDIFRSNGILNCVIMDPGSLSGAYLSEENLIMKRMEEGNVSRGNLLTREYEGELLERFFFQEYLLKYMGSYLEQKDKSVLKYQAEYLVTGDESDLENLKSVITKIALIREVANAIYLYSDEVKCLEAEILADLLASAAHVPEIAPVLKTSLILVWAFVESQRDVMILLNGDRVPLLKTEETWFYDLDHAMISTLALEKGTYKEGMTYEDYLRVFMTMTDLEVLTGRAMNLIEADIRQTAGNSHFRMDACYDALAVNLKMKSNYSSKYRYVTNKQLQY